MISLPDPTAEAPGSECSCTSADTGFYCIRHFDYHAFLRTLLVFSDPAPAASPPQDIVQADPEQYLSDLLMHIGVPPHLKGYRLVRQAILLAAREPHRLDCVTGMLYEPLAQLFDTPPACVEQAIRHAIAAAWDHSGPSTLHQLLGRRYFLQGEYPVNQEFIALLAEHMRLRFTETARPGRVLPPHGESTLYHCDSDKGGIPHDPDAP